MSEQTYHLEIITPEKVLVSGEIDSLEAPGVDGEFQILAGHTPFLTGLIIGPVIYSKSGKKKFVSISGGFCEVMRRRTVILAHTAELYHEIDKSRKLVLFHPGTGGSAINLSLEQYSEIANKISGSWDCHMVITAGPDELQTANKLSKLFDRFC